MGGLAPVATATALRSGGAGDQWHWRAGHSQGSCAGPGSPSAAAVHTQSENCPTGTLVRSRTEVPLQPPPRPPTRLSPSPATVGLRDPNPARGAYPEVGAERTSTVCRRRMGPRCDPWEQKRKCGGSLGAASQRGPGSGFLQPSQVSPECGGMKGAHSGLEGQVPFPCPDRAPPVLPACPPPERSWGVHLLPALPLRALPPPSDRGGGWGSEW